ncbi:MAG TPA: hypothetical protein VJQ25_09640, partial [Nitrospira sp.]|nr:hypothetical protein [Nitrospira sp.]
RNKDGIKDLEKAKHYLEKLIEEEKRKPIIKTVITGAGGGGRAYTCTCGRVSFDPCPVHSIP